MDHNWSECVIALYKSKCHKGIYRKMLGDHTVESAGKAGADFYLKEDKSGVFTLGRTGSTFPVNARHTRVFCPWHDINGHLLQAIDSKALVCTLCDPRLQKQL